MVRQRRNRPGSVQNAKAEPERDGHLIVGKLGVYMIRGVGKVKSLRLIPWDQLLDPSTGAPPVPSIR
jgi:hypothetical protein